MNDAPPSPKDFLYEISPLHFSMIFRHMARPRPVPELFVVKFGVNRRLRFSSVTPGPLSSNVMS